MATVKQMIKESDVVELLDPVEKWSVGTAGTVVSERGKLKLIEISDDRGVALDYVSVSEPRLRLIAKHSD
ncbi:MAG: hypothetical protein FVQ78_05335 [Solirubrobacterales bacterium]|nr:hypothetical protein [Solirubrobacterales bacterium]